MATKPPPIKAEKRRREKEKEIDKQTAQVKSYEDCMM